ncbi:MAG: ROK family protein [Pseudohongiellaceae bacterium]
MSKTEKTFAAIEAGGTKFVVAVGNANKILETVTIPTTTPDVTWAAVNEFLNQQAKTHKFSGIGFASFGPINLNQSSAGYGHIETTAKPHWSKVDMLAPLKQYGVPIALETDVNVAALGEALVGKGAGKKVTIYATIGTGIGVGIAIDGKMHGGMTHPEIGHIPVPHDTTADPYTGYCAIHGNCLEGLACGPAIIDRWGKGLSELEPNHPAYKLEADYLSLMCVTLMLTLSPNALLLGGGVMKAEGLLDLTRDRVFERLVNYLSYVPRREDLDVIIDKPEFFGQSAIIGCMLMAEELVA